jgi:hypothetical protein
MDRRRNEVSEQVVVEVDYGGVIVPEWIQNQGGDPDEFKRKFSSL